MKANEFVNADHTAHALVFATTGVSFIDLKRLVESWELVMDYYGLTKAKEHAESEYTAPEIKVALKQAIADVESCCA
mgnify:CR=1 FL=1